jgi:hypothetical protein
MKLELGFYLDVGGGGGLDERLIKNKDNLRLFRKFKLDNRFKVLLVNRIDDPNHYNQYVEFHKMLEDNLSLKHDTKPTHNLVDFLNLAGILADQQRLYLCYYEDKLVSGMYFIEVLPRKFYTVYIAQNYGFKNTGTLLGIVDYFLSSEKNGVDILDFGICTENNGLILNKGLANFKESSLTGQPTYRYFFN